MKTITGKRKTKIKRKKGSAVKKREFLWTENFKKITGIGRKIKSSLINRLEKVPQNAVIYQKRGIQISIRPGLALQGAAVLISTFLLLLFVGSFIHPTLELTESNTISGVSVKQITPAVAGKNDPIKWVALVKLSDVESGKYFLKIPKNAKNVKKAIISKEEAERLVISTLADPSTLLAAEDRRAIAQGKPFRNIAKMSGILFASLEEAGEALVEAVIDQMVREPDEPPVIQTDEAVIVDLSEEAEAKEGQKEEKKNEKEQKKEQKQEEKNEKHEEQSEEPATELNTESASAEAPASAEASAGETGGEAGDPKADEPATEPASAEAPAGEHATELNTEQTEEPASAEETANEPVQEIEEEPVPEEAPENEITESPEEIEEIEEIEQQPAEQQSGQPPAEEYVQVTYETPAPTISEQETSLGKLVTVSVDEPNIPGCPGYSAEAEQTNPLAAGLAKGLKNAIDAILNREEIPEPESATELNTEQATEQTEEPASAEASAGETGEETAVGSEQETTPSNCPPAVTNVLAYTSIPEIYNVGQEDKIKIRWKNENDQEMEFHAYDTDENGKLDYVEWTVPHLSEQMFEIIYISKAYELNENRQIIEDIYELVREQDGVWKAIPMGNYARVTYEQILDEQNDITIFAKPSNPSSTASIEVYPLYTNEQGGLIQGDSVAIFGNISHEGTYKIYLSNLETPTDQFELKVLNANVDFDYIVDPLPPPPPPPPVGAEKYWVGGTGNWSDDDNHWALSSGGSPGDGNIPTELDTVFFDANSGSGTVTIDQAGIIVGSVSIISTTLPVNVGSYGITAGTLLYTNSSVSGTGAISVSSLIQCGNSVTVSAPIALLADTTLYVDTGNTATVSGIISGGYGLAKTGAGTLVLSGANTFSGGLTIRAGKVQGQTSASAFGGSGTGAITIGDTTGTSNATLHISTNSVTYANPISVGAGSSGKHSIVAGGTAGLSGEITLNNTDLYFADAGINASAIGGGIVGTGNVIIEIAAAAGSFYFQNAAINMTGTFTNQSASATSININSTSGFGANVTNVIQNGTATLQLNSANASFAGIFTIKSGILYPYNSSANALGGATEVIIGDTTGSANATLAFRYGATAYTNPITVASGSSGELKILSTSSAYSPTLSGAITLNNNLIISSEATANTMTLSGAISGTGNISVSNSSNGAVTISNAVGGINHAGTITHTGAGPGLATISGIIGANVTGVIQNSATSTLVLSGNSADFGSAPGNGTVTIKAGIMWVYTNANAAGTATITIGDSTGSANASLDGASSLTFANPITVASGSSGTLSITRLNGNSPVFSGPITLNNNLTVTDNSGSLTLSGEITGTGNIILNATGAGTITLSNAVGGINHTGTITNSGAGSGAVGISGIIGANVTGVIQNSATSQLTLSGNNANFGSAPGSGAVTIKAGLFRLLTSANAAGTSAIILGDTTGNANAKLYSHALSISNPINVASGSGGKLAISGRTYNGQITLSNNLTIENDSTDFSIAGGIIGTGNLVIDGDTSNGITITTSPINFSGTITNSGGGSATARISAVVGSNVTGIIQNSATSALALSGNNSTVGDITITSGTLSLGDSTNLNVSDDWSNSGTFTAGTGSTVTFTAGDHTVTGANTFVNWTWSPNNTVTLPASTTQTISGTLTCAGTAGNLITLNSGTLGEKATLSKASGTVNCDYLAITDSSATGGATWNGGDNSTATNYDGWLGLNVAPNAPSLVSPESVSYTTDTTPTLSANYSDSDSADSGTTSYRISSTSLSDCVNNLNVVASGSSAETSDENENTTWTNGTSIGEDGTYYWCAQNSDGDLTSDWTQMGSFTLDTTDPATIATAGSYTFGQTSSTANISVTLICSDGSGSGCLSTVYCTDQENTCTPATSYATPFSITSEGVTYVRFYSVDDAGRTESIRSETVVIKAETYTPSVSGGAGAGGGGESSTAVQQPAETPGFIDQIVQIPQQIIEIPQQIAEQIVNILTPGQQQTQMDYPPITESVPAEPQEAFMGWEVLKPMPEDQIGSASEIPSNINFFAEKFSQFESAIKGLGINKIDDADVLKGVTLNLPGLTETALATTYFPTHGVEENELPVSGLPAHAMGGGAIPIANLTAKDIENIPEDVVFARTDGGLIDYQVKLTFDENGEGTQKINVTSGKAFDLVVKAGQDAKKVLGFLVLNEKTNPNRKQALRSFGAGLIASVIPPAPKPEEPPAELLLEKFEYEEVNSGLYRAKVTAPVVEGEYEIITIIEYDNPEKKPKETRLVTIIDPEGYVFRKLGQWEARIGGATVSIYRKNPDTMDFELWDAKKFLQENPVITNETGKYSFLVPQGTYYLKAEAKGFRTYLSDPFAVVQDIGVHMNIEMKPDTFLPSWLGWQVIFGVLMATIIGLLVYLIIRGKK